MPTPSSNSPSRRGTEHIDFKDIGLPREEMASLVDTIHAAGRQAHLEVVSLTEADARNSLQLGRELGFDYVLGGTRWQIGAEVLAGTGIGYFPYAGTVIGHPGTLDGTAEQILAEIEAMRESVAGVNLLAYRHIRVDGRHLVSRCARRRPSWSRSRCGVDGSRFMYATPEPGDCTVERHHARPTRCATGANVSSRAAHRPRCGWRSGG